MFNELEHIELLHLAYRLCRGRHVDPDAGLEQVDHDEAEADRDQAGDDEPGARPRSDAAESRAVAHMPGARDARAQDQRRDEPPAEVTESGGARTSGGGGPGVAVRVVTCGGRFN